ncbi:MAG: DUF4861 domain-containing protein [Rikenellaceae bacterium]|nr:DUF4861 domain-containing protein [Rikenellaceae bacterium]
MKKLFFLLAAAALAACQTDKAVEVEVANPTDVARTAETVELCWTKLSQSIEGLTPETVVVMNAEGEEIPSQVIYRGEAEPQALIFQCAVEGGETAAFQIAAGTRSEYEQQAFGRQVPERYDDYAWENNLSAYRLYGPALETSPEKLITPGIDVWVKCTEKLVIDEWYAKGDYHHNYGDGMDCYKVGRTLGGGASVPMLEGKFWPMEHNYATCQTLDNGPIRTTVKLVYVPWDVNGTAVSLVKTITLDANQRFNRMENLYEGAFEELPIAAGFVRHDVKGTEQGEGWIAMVEAVSDSKQPEVDGDIYQAIVLPGAELNADLLGHTLAVKAVKSGEKMTYYSASGWSQGGVENMEDWIETIKEQAAMVESPLQVTIK